MPANDFESVFAAAVSALGGVAGEPVDIVSMNAAKTLMREAWVAGRSFEVEKIRQMIANEESKNQNQE